MQKVIYQCPVCGYTELPRPPSDYLICPCCGTEFGYDDYVTVHEQLRQRWMALGAPWFSHTRSAPQGWSALAQLMTSGLLPRTIGLDAGVTTIKTDMKPEADNLSRVIATSQATQVVGVFANQIVTAQAA
jgi:hypothetical protein